MRTLDHRPLWLLPALAVGAVALVLLWAPPVWSQEEPEYVGSDLCQECHADQWESFEGSVHYAVTLEGDEEIGGCEACHGPGLTHAELAGTEEPGFREAIISFKKEDPWVESGQCLQCHAEQPAQQHFEFSEHSLAGVDCAECHDAHQPLAVEAGLKMEDPQLCFSCHGDQRGQFRLTERHPVTEGVMGCTDCHNPHGSSNRVQLARMENDSCTSCHVDKEGPWAFPHVAVEAENCSICHQPHGSVNPHMLTHREIRFTCFQCHTVQPGFHVQPGFAECNACHAQIHGSNLDPFFLR